MHIKYFIFQFIKLPQYRPEMWKLQEKLKKEVEYYQNERKFRSH